MDIRFSQNITRTKSECYEAVKAWKQPALDALDAQMISCFHTGRDYSRLKRRKILLLRRIEVLANRLYLSKQNGVQ